MAEDDDYVVRGSGDFKVMGSLWKKRGGLGRHMKEPWQPRAFGITHDGRLVYYEAKTVQEAENQGQGLRFPRQSLNLRASNAMWSQPEDATDGPTQYLIVIEHDLGQRWKMCAENAAECKKWTDALSHFCSKAPDGGSNLMGERPGRGLSPPPPRSSPSPKVTRKTPVSTPVSSGRDRSSSEAFLPNMAMRRTRSSRSKRKGKKDPPKKKQGLIGMVFMPEAGSTPELVYMMLTVNICCILLTFTQPASIESYAVVVLLNLTLVSALVRRPEAAAAGGGGAEVAVISRAETELLCDDDEGFGDEDGGGGPEEMIDAGQSIPRIENETLSAGETAAMPSFGKADHAMYPLRTVGYKQHKKKAPGEEPLYELIALDVFKTPSRVDGIYQYVNFPTDVIDTKHPEVPSLFVVNCQFPREKQNVFAEGDGPGASVVFYFAIKQSTVDDLHSGNPSAKVKLFSEWCRIAPDDPTFRARFKAMGFIDKIERFGLPYMCAKYNGKPVLIKKTGTVYRGPNNAYIEMDVNIHNFSYPCRQALTSTLKPMFKEMIMRVGFVIEGQEDHELPECLLGNAELRGLDLDKSSELSPH
mmetsp:Transcript_9042/g.16424  ORF Transcript_9042/g.16424 Transcript_9042/m.16424 type:complete len:585 (+) Transcript_9042:185-1939(+)|eukprot:CAMPEP_0205903532 /NCGR_PEP_ID=MMETSP1325-20131115/155_1 /ASSEMBLY_ACC=CAM_ASM_000708 /TAXON_ID=236786 /ORGANISM="Florenciella sp., Strain RCC1007" /LENGTH=584 /DNA_ID=CAMNT_0053269195 /DNA_START=185 /DNA_END=1939 /DNA_ORIENTATION=-